MREELRDPRQAGPSARRGPTARAARRPPRDPGLPPAKGAAQARGGAPAPQRFSCAAPLPPPLPSRPPSFSPGAVAAAPAPAGPEHKWKPFELGQLRHHADGCAGRRSTTTPAGAEEEAAAAASKKAYLDPGVRFLPAPRPVPGQVPTSMPRPTGPERPPPCRASSSTAQLRPARP